MLGTTVKWSLVLVCLTVLGGCMLTPDHDQFVARTPTAKNYALAELNNGTFDRRLSDLSQFALLASAAYRPQDRFGAFCPAVTKPIRRWRMVDGFSVESLFPEKPDHSARIGGLGYRVFEDMAAPGRRRFVLSFRGTDFKQAGDWYSNARWITRFNPFTYDQYQQVRDLTIKVVEKIDGDFGADAEIIAVGHSLGGGLAQQAAYTTKRIKLVYAFNTSPVTGATSIDYRVSPDSKRGVEIFRIYEAGEVLAALRWASRRVISLKQKDPKITELRFNFRSTYQAGSIGGGLIGQHAMRQVACDLICRVDKRHPHKECLQPVPPRPKDG